MLRTGNKRESYTIKYSIAVFDDNNRFIGFISSSRYKRKYKLVKGVAKFKPYEEVNIQRKKQALSELMDKITLYLEMGYKPYGQVLIN